MAQTLYNGGGNTFTIEVDNVLNGSMVNQAFFVAPFACQVTQIDWVHATAGTDVGAVNLQVRKQTGTQTPAQGVTLLTNNANAGFDMKATVNTVQNGTLTATTADLQLAAGDRLGEVFAGVVTALAGGVLTVSFIRL